MRNLTKNLMALWLAVALVIAPLQAMTAGIAGAGTGAAPCAMNPAAEAGAHDAHRAGQDSAASHCPSCSDHDCNQAGECSSQGCVSLHVQPAAMTAIRLHHIRHSDPRIIFQPTFVASRTDPPLLRPPV